MINFKISAHQAWAVNHIDSSAVSSSSMKINDIMAFKMVSKVMWGTMINLITIRWFQYSNTIFSLCPKMNYLINNIQLWNSLCYLKLLKHRRLCYLMYSKWNKYQHYKRHERLKYEWKKGLAFKRYFNLHELIHFVGCLQN